MYYFYQITLAMVEVRRVELLTSCLQGRRSSQLSYTPISKLVYERLTLSLSSILFKMCLNYGQLIVVL